jgi:DNA polymerase III alpha subunit
MKISGHTHVESPLTGSTIADMLHRAKAIGRTHFFFADHGHLSSALKVARVMKDEEKRTKTKLGLKIIPGIEIYFKDTQCPIIAGTPAFRCRYFTATLYCEDQKSFQELSKIVSRTDFPTFTLYEEKQNLWGWSHLEEISKLNVTLILGGVHCMVGKVFLAKKPDLAEAVLLRLRGLFGDRLYTSIITEPYSKKYSQIVEISYFDGTRDTCLTSDFVSTDKARRIKALDMVERQYHTMVKAIYANGSFKDVNKLISGLKLHKGFLPLPEGDAMTRVNKFLKALSKRHGIPVLVSDYAYYSQKDDKIVQTMRLEGNKLHPTFHMKTTEEVESYLVSNLGLTKAEVLCLFEENEKWAKRFDKFELKYDWRLADAGEDPIRKAMSIIKENGRMQWNNPVWVDRLKEELNVIAKNPKKDLTPYFLPIRDILNHYKENGQLTGPGRGSAGGSLFCYLLGITQINPFLYDLPFNRFFSMERIMMLKLPDIDCDLGSRDLLVGEDGKSGYLYGRWGDKAAQISTRTTIRLKSAVKDTNRYLKGKVEQEIDTFSKGLPQPPQGVNDHDYVFGFDNEDGEYVPGLLETSDDLRRYVEKRPEEWAIVNKAMGLTKAYSKHASAFVLSDVPIKDVVPVKDGNITQYEAKECESAGLIKYDFLVINQLKDIQVCMELINKKLGTTLEVGQFMHQGNQLYIWDLPEVDEVYRSIWSGNTESIFQISTASMTPAVMEILPTKMMHLANILALIRPGPADCVDEKTGRNMVEEYYLRRKGEGQIDIQELVDILPETYGIMIFQEQLSKVSKILAGFSNEEAEKLRENMAKKRMVELMKMKPQFIDGASKKVSKETAEHIWNQMVTFGRYGFSIIHAVEYAMITYACMFLKHYYPLEWWAAILTNATEQEISGKFWPYVKDVVAAPDINLSSDTMVVDYANGKLRAKLGIIRGIGDDTIEPIVAGRPYKNVQDFVDRDVAGQALSHKLIIVGVLDSLFPAKMEAKAKLKAYEDAREVKTFRDKLEKATAAGKKVRATQPKEGQVPKEYDNLTAFQDAALKKSVLPSMPINLSDLGKMYSKALTRFEVVPSVMLGPDGYPTRLVDGGRLQVLCENSGETMEKDEYVAATCFVVKTEEFTYQKGAKKALKLIVDCDGFVSEQVLWPNYDTGILTYPPEVKKGSICTIFLRKKIGKKDLSIQGIVVE